MFNLFKKKSLHEPLNLQIADVKKYDPIIIDSILKGIDCDYLPKGEGPFGSINNPIPVNGLLGEIKYLGKLRGKTGHAVFFHRIGSFKSTISEHLIDKYELVCNDSTQWSFLFFDMYHPRRSEKSPNGFSLTPYNEKLKMDIPFAYGVDFFMTDFPYSLPNELDRYYGTLGAFGRNAKKWLELYKFEKHDLIK